MGKGFPLEDEGEFGSVHIGLGEGRSFGSSIRAKAHVDLVVRAPIAELDGQVLLQNKEFTLNGRKFKIGEGGAIEGL
jgi:leucyl aminopeptidase (aminopeptidase T)